MENFGEVLKSLDVGDDAAKAKLQKLYDEKGADAKEVDPVAKAQKAGAPKEVVELLKAQIALGKQQSEQLQKQEERFLKAEADKQRLAYVAIAKGFEAVGAADELGGVLQAISTGCDAPIYDYVKKVFGRLTKSTKASELLKEVGNTQAGDSVSKSSDIDAKAVEMAKAMVAADPSLKLAIAKAQVWKQNPEMFTAFNAAKKTELN